MTDETKEVGIKTELLRSYLLSLGVDSVTRETILNMCENDPTVQHTLKLWHRGLITWEQAMMYCTVWLSIMLKSTREELVEMKNNEIKVFSSTPDTEKDIRKHRSLKLICAENLEIGKWYHVWTPKDRVYCGYGKAREGTGCVYIPLKHAPALNFNEFVYAEEEPPITGVLEEK